MGTIAEELQTLAANKAAIKAAIESKNPSVMPTNDMSQWPSAIQSISGKSGYDVYIPSTNYGYWNDAYGSFNIQVQYVNGDNYTFGNLGPGFLLSNVAKVRIWISGSDEYGEYFVNGSYYDGTGAWGSLTTISQDMEITRFNTSDICLLEGTKILLADGT